MFINKNYTSKLIKEICIDGFHHIHVDLVIKNHHYHIHGVYRPPNFDYVKFADYMENIFCTTRANHSCFIVGDINIPINNTADNITDRYQRLLETYNYISTNIFPTRPSSGNILDHVLCQVDESCNLRNDTVCHDLSDHSLIILNFLQMN